jgi:hypothetical protein
VVVRAFYTPISETEETDDISQAPWDSPVLKPPVILPLHQPVILAGEGFAPPGAYTSLLLYARYTRIDIPEGTFTTSTLVKLSVIKPADLSEPEKEGLLAVAMRFYFGSRPSKDILLTMEISQDERRWLPYMNESQPLARTQLAPLLRTPAVRSASFSHVQDQAASMAGFLAQNSTYFPPRRSRAQNQSMRVLWLDQSSSSSSSGVWRAICGPQYINISASTLSVYVPVSVLTHPGFSPPFLCNVNSGAPECLSELFEPDIYGLGGVFAAGMVDDSQCTDTADVPVLDSSTSVAALAGACCSPFRLT